MSQLRLKEQVQQIFKGCKVTGETAGAETQIKAYTTNVLHYQLEALTYVLKEYQDVAIEMKRSGIYVVIIFSAK